jgi:hypothetical protein
MPRPTKLQIAVYTPFTGWPFQQLPAECGDDTPSKRLEWLSMKMSQAKNLCTDSAAHKVFVAPEWLFRKKGDDAMITEDEMKAVVKGITTLSSAYKNWLIVGGSIYWGTGKPGKWTVYNTGIAVSEGKQLCLLYKKNNADTVLDADGKPKQNLPTQTWGGQKVKGDGLFDWAELKCGLEICADHNDATLVKSFTAKNPAGGGIDLHILISASIKIQKGKVASKDKGIVVQCEGNNSDDAKNKKTSATVATVSRVGNVADCYATKAGTSVTLAEIEETKKKFTGASIVQRIVLFPTLDVH